MKKPKGFKGQKRVSSYLKFSNLAIQMAVIITAGALGGRWLDEKQGNEVPVWTLVLVLIAVFGSMYQIIRAVIKMGETQDKEDKKAEEKIKDEE